MSVKPDKQEFLTKAQVIAIDRGGKCLSTEYVNSLEQMLWECNKHNIQWEASYKSVVGKNTWCPLCAKEKRAQALLEHTSADKPDLLVKAREYAISHGGKCLSQEYKNVLEPMVWFCDKHNHEWSSSYRDIVGRDKWCPLCYQEDKDKKRSAECDAQLTRAKHYAEGRGGICLSSMYVGTSEKLDYKCSNPSHEPFSATFDDTVNKGTWCPKCSVKNIGENRVRLLFETFFGVPFTNCRPDWNLSSDSIHPHISEAERAMLKLKPRKVVKIELDGLGYVDQKKFGTSMVAFEYQGMHHYDLLRYGDNISRLKRYAKTTHHDMQKIENCKNHGVRLFVIPEVPRDKQRSFEKFLEFVSRVLEEQGLRMHFTEEQILDMKMKYGEA